MTKRCRWCGRELRSVEFTTDRGQPDELHPICRACVATRLAQRKRCRQLGTAMPPVPRPPLTLVPSPAVPACPRCDGPLPCDCWKAAMTPEAREAAQAVIVAKFVAVSTARAERDRFLRQPAARCAAQGGSASSGDGGHHQVRIVGATMRACALGLLLCVIAAPTAQAQLLYNPRLIEFESVDHALVTGYRVEVLDAKSNIVSTVDVPVAQVVTVPGMPVKYQIAMPALDKLPVGQTYHYRLRSLGTPPFASDPSAVAPQSVRFSSCVVGGQSGTAVAPMTIALGPVPTLQVEHWATLPITITAPEPVYAVSIDLVTDGQPAWYVISTSDLRGTNHYTIGPFARAGTSAITIGATGSYGCGTIVTPQMVTVVR